MTEQLALIETPAPPAKPLTDRQQFALELVERRGVDGIHADEVGAALCERNGRHSADDRCRFDGSSGNEVLKALRGRDLVRYRRGSNGKPGYWQATTANAQQPAPTKPGVVPYNEFPEGF